MGNAFINIHSLRVINMENNNMLSNKAIKAFSNFLLLTFLCIGQVAAVPLDSVKSSMLKVNTAHSLNWNSFLGGSGGYEIGSDIFADEAGDIFIVGTSYPYYIDSSGSYTDPTWGTPIRAFGGGDGDVFVAKINSSGNLVWNTFLGGSGVDRSPSIVVDELGSIYVTGNSFSSWGNPIHQHSNNGSDGFVAKINASGALIWNTFLGNSDIAGSQGLTGIDLDASGNIYITGSGDDTWNISTPPLHPFNGSLDAFVIKMTPSGNVSWRTFLGGAAEDGASEIVIAENGNIYLTGTSYLSWGNPILSYPRGFWTPFIAKLNPSGILEWNTFLGSGRDRGTDIVLDEIENIYVTGTSSGTWGNPVRAFEASVAFPVNSFAAKLDSNGNLIFNTFLGSGQEEGDGISLDIYGFIYLTGTGCYEWGNPFRALAQCTDAFVAKLDNSGNLLSNGFLGGDKADYGTAVNINGDGNVYMIGASEEGWGNPVRSFNANLLDKPSGDVFVTRLSMPATFIYVTSTNNSGTGSLRQAIADALNGDIIAFAPSLAGQIIHLESELVVDKSIIIDGSSLTTPITVSGDTDNDGDGDVQLMNISSSGNLLAKNMIFTKGISLYSNLFGGIINLGQLTVTNSEFSYNEGAKGGAIQNSGTLTISNTIFTYNAALEGGAIWNGLGAQATIINSTFSNNSADYGGGVTNYGTLNVIKNNLMSNSTSPLYGAGGGIMNFHTGILTVEDSSISNNSADSGGGIFNFNTADIINSTIAGNSVTTNGGGISTWFSLTLTNSTVVDNHAETGGGVFNLGTLTTTNVTLSENAATTGGGVYNSFVTPEMAGTFNYSNTIIANSTSGADCYNDGLINTNINNLVENNAASPNQCGIPVLSEDPKLGLLKNNGGFTQTLELLPNSQAIDAGDDATCTSDPVNNTSQNGVTRPRGSHCDIGAYEHSSPFPDLIITNVTISPTVPLPNQTFEISITIKNQGGTGSANTIFRDVYINRDPSTLIDSATGCPPPGDFFRSDSYTSLPAGMTDTKTVTITGGLPSGNHQFWFYVDSRCLVDEGGGSNSIP